ncbi:MAG: dTDP-glucose 4,6-dehydratase [Actinomycetota bacterium]|nr:dTDP-glucose 4,6-dehydratase [Actinomycetota bacterium]
MPDRVLITGGAGFIGSHLCEHFLDRGAEVECLDNFLTGSRDNVAHLADNPAFQLVEHDITTPYFPATAPTLVLHFASPASPPQYLANPIHTLKVGGLGSLHALGIAKASGARFLLASTSEIYGDPTVSPQPETYWGNVSSTGPRGVYDEAKRYSEAITMAYHRAHGVDTRIVRIFNTYGPRLTPGDGRAIPNFMSQALSGAPLTIYGDGSQTRSFCYVDDLVQGIAVLIERGGAEPVNLGNPDERTILELAELIIDVTGSDSKIGFEPLPEDDPKVRCPDITLARDLLGWEPAVSLEDGLGRTLEWFRSELV